MDFKEQLEDKTAFGKSLKNFAPKYDETARDVVAQENWLSLQNKNYEDMANKSKDDRIRELKAALRKAQKEAELEKLRAKVYEAIEAFVQYIPLR